MIFFFHQNETNTEIVLSFHHSHVYTYMWSACDYYSIALLTLDWRNSVVRIELCILHSDWCTFLHRVPSDFDASFGIYEQLLLSKRCLLRIAFSRPNIEFMFSSTTGSNLNNDKPFCGVETLFKSILDVFRGAMAFDTSKLALFDRLCCWHCWRQAQITFSFMLSRFNKLLCRQFNAFASAFFSSRVAVRRMIWVRFYRNWNAQYSWNLMLFHTIDIQF